MQRCLTNQPQRDFLPPWGSDLPTRRHAEESRPVPIHGRTMSSINPTSADALATQTPSPETPLPPAAEAGRPLPSLTEAFHVWLKVASLSFGGPAGQIAVMHRILVDEKRWISEERFLHALNYCMLLPGPEAQQLATYVGWLMHRTLGGIVAGGLFVLPGIIAIMALSYIYAAFGNVPLIVALFFGLKAAVLAI